MDDPSSVISQNLPNSSNAFFSLNVTNDTTIPQYPFVYGLLLRIYDIVAGFLFIFGVVGNLWVICRISQIFYLAQCSKSRRKPNINVKSINHIYVYILCLSIVDLLVLSVIPLLLAERTMTWVFGTLMCKYYYTMESMNKLMSIMLLTVLSGDRYMAVCHMWRCPSIRQPKSVLMVIGCCAILAILLLMPLILTADVNEWPLGNGEFVKKCAVDMLIDDQMFTIFVTYIFIFGYCIPAALICFFYSSVLVSVRSHTSSSLAPTMVPTRSLVFSVLRVVIFYFICWSPYWIFMLMTCYYYRTMAGMPPNSFIIMSMYVHELPYLNSAGNWIFYALFNRDLSQTVENMHTHAETESLGMPSIQITF